MKFENRGFAPSGNTAEEPEQAKKEFIRDESDNILFRKIQVDDINTLIRPETVFYADFDMPVYQIASNLEQKRIKAVCKSEPSIVIDCKGIREFKGLGKKISESSELGVLNTKRSVEGLPELSPEDFEVEQYQTLNMEEDKAFETAKIQVYTKLKEYRLQYCIPKVVPVLGEGASFREFEPTCKRYKSNRKETLRPILLKKIRKWVIDELGGIMTTETRGEGNLECDDKIEILAAEGYRHYRKHGWFSIGVLSGDKDSLNSPKILINADRYHGNDKSKKGKLRFPKPMLIEATDRCCGELELISKTDSKGNTSQEVKGFGFKFLLFQAFLGLDSADFYDALGHLGKGFNFGISSAYKTLQPCKTAKEALQATIDVFADKLPYGVQYTDHLGNEHDVDTMTYMDIYFRIAYMLRSVTDDMDFYKLCKAMKVDTSKIENNNLLSPPVKTYCGNEDHIKELSSLIQSIISEDMKGCKQLKSAEKNEVFDKIKSKLESVDFECHYEYVQHEKNLEK